MQSNGLRTQYPYSQDGLSPRPLYDYPSPTSNYPSYMSGASPGFERMAEQPTPQYGNSSFIPPADVFLEKRKGSAPFSNPDTPREAVRQRASEVLSGDPVAVHLLVETAMDDSQNYEILSVDELEGLKKEQSALIPRIEALRKRLERETKVRGAAANLHRLTSQKEKGHKRNFSSRSKNSVTDSRSSKSEEELNASMKKCEDLSRELFDLESRARFIQMQLLMHTAGILQLTHNGPAKLAQNSQLPNGVGQRPDSPASLFTYENSRANRIKTEDNFDERSLYRSPENLDSLMEALRNGTHLNSESVAEQSETLAAVEKRLEELNDRLVALIIQANPERNRDYQLPPRGTKGASVVEQHLDFLDQGLRDIGAEQNHLRDTSRHSLNAIEGRLEGISNQLYAILNRSRSDEEEKHLPPPPITGGDPQEQLKYLEESVSNVEQLQYYMEDEIEALRSKPQTKNQDSQYETTLLGLWSIMQAGEEQARERKAERRRLLGPNPNDDDDLSAVSENDDSPPMEEFSLSAFSTKVQWLYSRASSLKEKEGILRRQIKQQRELNSRSDEQKEAEFSRLHDLVDKARLEKAAAEEELNRAIDQLQQFDDHRNNTESEALRDLQDRYQNLEAQLKDTHEAHQRSQALEAQLRDAQDDARIEAAEIKAELSGSLARIEELNGSLRAAASEKEAAEARHAEATNALNAKEEELRELEGEVVRLTTELTFAKAELDGAYGTRAERAAEVAANPTIKKELDDLTSQNAALRAEVESLRKAQEAASSSEAQARDAERTLKQELSAMTTDYEALTRESIQNEKERDNYEALIDALKDEKEKLEMELSDERVRWLGVRSPGAVGPPTVEATSIRMLREDFRRMMRERTAEGLKAIRHEQEERRKLEGLIRTLKKEAAPPKSNLSKIMTA
ncbi:hypothetical protein GQ43DRAFT_388890 [Delitschia confertaspora ATCC 74209]|uniref:Up-regulated during septation protein 1 domain-containing protein n=1 Tax=Delitschia confertaspora ATCC 74209 TaxID=1513339 RepID=A0A9P4JV47_9PLEO|nr:hypothetical protein GQ43DRAFT_388890 [Delitschia confertaspora ATCC 74209]